VPTHKPDLSQLSITQLADLTGRDADTIRKRLDGIEPAKVDGRTRWYRTREALPRIYEALDLSAERARLAREQADAKAMENAVSRGELIPKPDVETAMLAVTSPIALKLDGLPSKPAPHRRSARWNRRHRSRNGPHIRPHSRRPRSRSRCFGPR
jgi:phage terminase Nu1 subunit (DNA packaging protein)